MEGPDDIVQLPLASQFSVEDGSEQDWHLCQTHESVRSAGRQRLAGLVSHQAELAESKEERKCLSWPGIETNPSQMKPWPASLQEGGLPPPLPYVQETGELNTEGP